ncbi:hypothetical protein SAMD00019534_002370 [Acytostelium subglobosum LB1]|uniref:hypothetical protein n=1 Tax=Acytostelium subglobosum LB1 TaxID=1410327 RepID=UPI000644B70F|nr:hypothetical protein SAMD00019534_002370 [Acytostelium subglobosum LB1]GAM17062.1 hypothetical protein SAMD00019534_002370 [Acytostelium subglobosum LB1]|eukprot:XP_012759124.1 hypothetical protein SAMD00019534_002370 [Acytostelium subglobosum LB1]
MDTHDTNDTDGKTLESLPPLILRMVLSYFDGFGERLVVSLVNKRLFVNRNKYLTFIDTKAYLGPFKHNALIKLNLNSYYDIISKDFITNCRSADVDLKSYVKDNDIFDVEGLKHDLNMTNLREVYFSNHKEEGLHPLSEAHPQWHAINEMLYELVERGVTLSLKVEGHPFPLEKVPLSSLVLEDCQGAQLQQVHFPRSLTYLKLCKHSCILDHILPDGLRILDLTRVHFKFHRHAWFAPNSLPRRLETILLSGAMKQRIEPDTFPSSLTTLELRHVYGESDFSYPLNGVLPPSITYLNMSSAYEEYRHDLTDLPISLTRMHLPRWFQQKLHHPPLENLHVHCTVPRGHSFPNLTKLRVSSLERINELDFSLFPNLNRLTIDRGWFTIKTSSLPMSQLRHTSLSFDNTSYVQWQVEIDNKVPFGIEKLELGSCNFQNVQPGSLPKSITRLVLWRAANLRPGHIPSSVTTLELHNYRTNGLNVYGLPPSVQNLTLIDIRDSVEIIRRLPPSVISVTVGRNAKHSIKLQRLDDQLFLLCPFDDVDTGDHSNVMMSVKECCFMDIKAIAAKLELLS